MKEEYTKMVGNKKARLLLKKLSENEYQVVEFDYIDEAIGSQLLKEVTDDADNEGVTLQVYIDKKMGKILESKK